MTNRYNLWRSRFTRIWFTEMVSGGGSHPRIARAAVWTTVFLFVCGGFGAVAQRTARSSEPAPDSPPVVIDTESLPGAHPKAAYEVKLLAHGGAAPYQWKVDTGDLPPGLKLEDEGTLHGSPTRSGKFHFTISARDGSRPQQVIQREYTLNVAAAISMEWKTLPHVTGSRIDGSVTVTNTTEDDLDFTFVVEAIADNGRATAIGYQRFPLKKGTIDFELPFGETLPHGAYLVNVDGVGEIADKNEIHRTRLQTPNPLQVVAGP
ncbi:MAG: putative Ig domain-containing protein [Candidatus Sulfotelmatobacter sp.]